MEYKIPLLNKGINTKNVTFSHLMAAFLLIIMGAVAFVIVALLNETAAAVANDGYIKVISGLYIACGFLILYITISQNKKIIIKQNSNKLRYFELALLFPVLLFCVLKEWYVPAAYAGVGVFGILYAFYYENSSEKQPYLTINETGIYIPKHKTSFLPWEKVLRLIIRHNIVSIEAKGNKLFQLDIAKNALLNTEAIEEYATAEIKRNIKLIKNDW